MSKTFFRAPSVSLSVELILFEETRKLLTGIVAGASSNIFSRDFLTNSSKYFSWVRNICLLSGVMLTSTLSLLVKMLRQTRGYWFLLYPW